MKEKKKTHKSLDVLVLVGGVLQDISLPAFVRLLTHLATHTHTHWDAVKSLERQQQEQEEEGGGAGGGLKTSSGSRHILITLFSVGRRRNRRGPPSLLFAYILLDYHRLTPARRKRTVIISKLSRMRALSERFSSHRLVTSGLVFMQSRCHTRRTTHVALTTAVRMKKSPTSGKRPFFARLQSSVLI